MSLGTILFIPGYALPSAAACSLVWLLNVSGLKLSTNMCEVSQLSRLVFKCSVAAAGKVYVGVPHQEVLLFPR